MQSTRGMKESKSREESKKECVEKEKERKRERERGMENGGQTRDEINKMPSSPEWTKNETINNTYTHKPF